jgi:uncharacterized membrane protein YfcA
MQPMWEQYRKTLIPTQMFIISACIVGYYWGQLSFGRVLPAFLFMQLAAIAGAWWAARLKRKIERAQNKLPLEK